MSALDESRLPPSIGELAQLALTSYAKRAPFFLLLALAVAVVMAIVEWTLPAAAITTQQGEFKSWVLVITQLFADAYVVAAVALSVGVRIGGATMTTAALAGAAADRWLRVIAVSVLAEALVFDTVPFSGLGPVPDPPALLIVAPFVWLLWGILGLTGPLAALSAARGGLAVMAGFGRAFTLSMHRANLLRLCVLGALTIIPSLIQAILIDQLLQHHVARALFWANVPLDALIVGPLAALQTIFALDFARRSGLLDPPKT